MPVHSKNSRVLINENHVSGHVSNWSVSHSCELGQVTSILDTATYWIPGLMNDSLSVGGSFNADAGGLYDEIKSTRGVDGATLVTVLPDGFTTGKPALFAVTDSTGIEVASALSSPVGLTVNAQADGLVDMGVALHALTAETANGNGSSIDNLASSANGGAAALHITGYTGLTNIAVKVQHSTNNSTWVDLITFATATAVTSQFLTVSGTVNRYVRTLWTVSGTGSATFAVAFARR